MTESEKKPDVLKSLSTSKLAENYALKLLKRAAFSDSAKAPGTRNLVDPYENHSEFDVRLELWRKIGQTKDLAELHAANKTLLGLCERFSWGGTQENFTESIAEVGILMYQLGEKITSESLMQSHNSQPN